VWQEVTVVAQEASAIGVSPKLQAAFEFGGAVSSDFGMSQCCGCRNRVAG